MKGERKKRPVQVYRWQCIICFWVFCFSFLTDHRKISSRRSQRTRTHAHKASIRPFNLTANAIPDLITIAFNYMTLCDFVRLCVMCMRNKFFVAALVTTVAVAAWFYFVSSLFHLIHFFLLLAFHIVSLSLFYSHTTVHGCVLCLLTKLMCVYRTQNYYTLFIQGITV